MQALIPQHSSPRASLAEVFAHTDFEWRLAQIPDDALCRGAFINMLDEHAGALSAETQAEYRRFFRIYRFTPFRMYPARDFLTRMGILAQVHWGGEGIYSGIRSLQSQAFDAWASTLLGRAALAIVDPSLPGVLRMIERAYASHTLTSYAGFEIRSMSDREIVTYFRNEYLPIEHAMVGALEGVLRLCKAKGDVTAELDGPFDGCVRITLV
ncbi:MAG TPA: DUF2378 family protein [Polyangiaceae bacterium]